MSAQLFRCSIYIVFSLNNHDSMTLSATVSSQIEYINSFSETQHSFKPRKALMNL